MTHSAEILEHLPPYVLGLPDGDPDNLVSTHLRSCETCGGELRELRETAALLSLGIQPEGSHDDLRQRILDRVTGRSFQFILSSGGQWQQDGALEIKQLYSEPAAATSLISLRTGSWLADAYRPGHLGYVILRGELDGEGVRLSTGDFIPAAGKVPDRKMSAVMDTVLLAVAGSANAEPLDSPRAVRSGKAAWSPMEPGTYALPLAGSAQEGVEISLLRIEPGAKVARHRHDWIEELCLISGDCRLQETELGPEDYHRASAGTTHDVTTSVGGCTMVYIIRKGGSEK